MLLIAIITLSLPSTLGFQFFHGRQERLFSNINITQSCNTSLNYDLRCPETAKFLANPDTFLHWTTEALSDLCSEQCRSDLAIFAETLEASCTEEVMRFVTRKSTFGDFGDLLSFRASHLCLREDVDGGDYCVLASDKWDVQKLHESGQASWPEHTEKCLMQKQGRCTPPEPEDWYEEQDVGVPHFMFQRKELAGLDYVMNRTGALEAAKRHSLGWHTRLELDEFPLEIQCRRCFWKPWAAAHESKWGHLPWDQWSESTWSNIVRNCNITGEDAIITPWRNLTAECFASPDDDDLYYDEPFFEPDWEFCPSTYIIPNDNALRISDIAKAQNFSMACIRSFNKVLPQPHLLKGHRLCVPRTCEVEVIAKMQSANTFALENSDRFSLQQLLRWNPCLNRDSVLFRADTVCTGPHKGRYEIAVVSLDSQHL